jgi:tRNA(adenine34) deaminase
MCIGAAVLARIDRLVFGCFDPKSGAVGSLFDVSSNERLNHKIEVRSGVRENECTVILKNFFKELRLLKLSEKEK